MKAGLSDFRWSLRSLCVLLSILRPRKALDIAQRKHDYSSMRVDSVFFLRRGSSLPGSEQRQVTFSDHAVRSSIVM